MSAHVNLLPPELAQRSKATRSRNITILAVVLWVVLLGIAYVIKLGTVAGVETERDQAQADVERLNQQVAELERFAELDRQLTARNNLLAAAMGTEVSWARVLNDLALAFPGNSSLVTFTATTTSQAQGTATQADPSTTGRVGGVQFTGYSVEQFAPGVEGVLLRLNDVRGVRNTFLVEGVGETRDRTDLATFSGRTDLTEEIYTHRYADGLPAERNE